MNEAELRYVAKPIEDNDFLPVKEFRDSLGYNFMSVENFISQFCHSPYVIMFGYYMDEESRKNIISTLINPNHYDILKFKLYRIITEMKRQNIYMNIGKDSSSIDAIYDILCTGKEYNEMTER